MRRIAAQIVEDRKELPEIDDVDFGSRIPQPVEVPTANDPFMSVSLSKQSKKIKSRYYRLRKKFESVDGEVGRKYKDPNEIYGYGLFDAVEPPYNLESLATLYEENSTLNAAVNARTMNTVGLGYKWIQSRKAQQKIEKATGKPDSLERIRKELAKEEDKLEDIFESFNQEDAFTEVLIKIWLDVMITGNGYMEIGRKRNGTIGYVGHIPSPLIRVRRKRDGFVQLYNGTSQATFFRHYGDTTTKDPVGDDPNPNEIIHFKQYSPTNNYYGVPSAISALQAIIGDKFAKDYNIDYFENKAIPRYAVILKGAKISNKSKQEIVNYFRNEVKGKNHGTLIIPLPASFGVGNDVDLKFEKLEDGVQDASFDKYRKANRDEIVIATRVPASKIGITENANLAVSRDADKTFKIQVVGPDQKMVEKRVNRIVKEFSDLLLFEFETLDIIDDDLRSRIYDRYLRLEVMTPNEVRGKLGLPLMEGGDDVLPYPSKTRQKEVDHSIQMDKEEKKNGDKEDDKSGGGRPGAPTGNSNAISGTPPKSSQDAANRSGSSNVSTGTSAERGQRQDERGVRE